MNLSHHTWRVRQHYTKNMSQGLLQNVRYRATYIYNEQTKRSEKH